MIKMPRRARERSRSGIYHVMLRGANKQEIFHDDEDCLKFLDTILKYKMKIKMSVYAWCLMNNHVHLLLKEGNEDLSTTMKRIGVSFVSYYNSKYETTGHLFQDRFRSETVETDGYLVRVIRYIHQNPVKAGIVKNAAGWRWSSCHIYYDDGKDANKLLDDEFVLWRFSDDLTVAKKRFREFNEINKNDECLDDRLNERKRLSDEEARLEIKKLIGVLEIAQVKSMPKLGRDDVLRKVKKVDGLSQRQAARIIGVSASHIFKA